MTRTAGRNRQPGEQLIALLGTFDRRFSKTLRSPDRVKKHQRYIPVLDQQGELTNHFIVVRNGDHQQLINGRNLQVIFGALADAERCRKT